ncbi:Lysine histidine transporter-like 5 [Euphorbia peplus]|nr:Lysine histidine transporter-like 5 [Euphorbia peplus]
MWKGVVLAYIIVVICYTCVSISGFWAFGNTVEDDILILLEKPSWLIAAANFMLFLHVVGSYQVFSMPMNPSSSYSLNYIRCIYWICSNVHSIFRWITWIFRRTCFWIHVILYPLYNVAYGSSL